MPRAIPMTMTDLAKIPAPEPTKTWRPVAHADLVMAVRDRLAAHDLEVLDSQFEVSPGNNYGNLFGTLRLAHWTGGRQWMLGVRNSHVKRFGAGLVAGVHVMVCSNEAFSGEIIQVRKHTSGLTLEELERFIERAITAALHNLRQYLGSHERLARYPLSEPALHWALIEAVRRDALRPTRLLDLLNDHMPVEAEELGREFPEYADRIDAANAYQLMQASMRTWRGDPVMQVHRRSAEMQNIIEMAVQGGERRDVYHAEDETEGGAEEAPETETDATTEVRTGRAEGPGGGEPETDEG